MTVKQAREWILFNSENPLPEEQIKIQIAMVASIFANATIKRKDRKSWKTEDFIPKFNTIGTKPKDHMNNLKSQVIGMVDMVGDKKAKKWAENQLNKQVDTMVKGTDGKMYKYKLEEFVEERKTLPKRLQLRNR
jgi:hypothetical protein